MNSVTSFIVLLACVTTCFSAADILKCKCRNTVKNVNKKLIDRVTEYKPRPYCNKHEVIVYLKNNTSVCLDPDSEFTKALLKIMTDYPGLKRSMSKSNEVKVTPALLVLLVVLWLVQQ